MVKRFLYRNFLEEEVEKRFSEEYDEEWGIYLSDNLTGDWYNINPSHIVDTCNKLWEQVVKLREENEQLRKRNRFLEEFDGQAKTVANLKAENEQLKEELQRFKKYVFSQDNILCYKCGHCIKKDIYVVDCEMKGEVDVHGVCGWFREVKV